jgi:predicted AlkP superfamily phosphohydrolase/phosphomutase
MNKKLIIIGLDGATWRVISPLIEQEKLPNMRHLEEKGAFGVFHQRLEVLRVKYYSIMRQPLLATS